MKRRLISGAGVSIYGISNRPSHQDEPRNATPLLDISDERFRPTARRFDVRVLAQDNICPLSTPPSGSFTSPGASAISGHGAASTVQAILWESCGSSEPTRML